ncbi:hypothetical protein [Streptomyces wuyuanensis]|uniref:Uncharacterized protein n=1 Tax=Streptomyces wuyuanensis TaxID=1196353 RepID=A0A1G9NS67_9ACTN|nr:hypothetical protein [Streptomyces wuyuanensis]SDL88825.1 hypothetical protein SAMN05444921_10250 [Streptomyces wuyuanensis]
MIDERSAEPARESRPPSRPRPEAGRGCAAAFVFTFADFVVLIGFGGTIEMESAWGATTTARTPA